MSLLIDDRYLTFLLWRGNLLGIDQMEHLEVDLIES